MFGGLALITHGVHFTEFNTTVKCKDDYLLDASLILKYESEKELNLTCDKLEIESTSASFIKMTFFLTQDITKKVTKYFEIYLNNEKYKTKKDIIRSLLDTKILFFENREISLDNPYPTKVSCDLKINANIVEENLLSVKDPNFDPNSENFADFYNAFISYVIIEENIEYSFKTFLKSENCTPKIEITSISNLSEENLIKSIKTKCKNYGKLKADIEKERHEFKKYPFSYSFNNLYTKLNQKIKDIYTKLGINRGLSTVLENARFAENEKLLL